MSQPMSLQQMIQAAAAAIIAAGDALTNYDEPTTRNQLQSAICYLSFAEMELSDYPTQAERRPTLDERIRANRERSFQHNRELLALDADFEAWLERGGVAGEDRYSA